MNVLQKCLLALCLLVSLLLAGCGRHPDQSVVLSVPSVLIVLGNEPLDDSTPTVDTIARVNKAVEFWKADTNAIIVFTGGPTAGKTTEARMMADLATASGVPSESMMIEGKATSTEANARLSAQMIKNIKAQRILIVSKADHLEWAMPIFRKVEVFRSAEPLPCVVTREASIAQMREYLKTHDSPRVRQRLEMLEHGTQGTD